MISSIKTSNSCGNLVWLVLGTCLGPVAWRSRWPRGQKAGCGAGPEAHLTLVNIQLHVELQLRVWPQGCGFNTLQLPVGLGPGWGIWGTVLKRASFSRAQDNPRLGPGVDSLVMWSFVRCQPLHLHGSSVSEFVRHCVCGVPCGIWHLYVGWMNG